MLRDTPVLRAKINEPKSKDSSNTVLSKKFEGGTTLNMVGSNSAASVASRAVRVPVSYTHLTLPTILLV